MDQRTKIQIAGIVDDAIVAHGLKGSTKPILWLKSMFAPFFERDLPMQRMSLREFRMVALLYAFLLPLLVVPVLFALPVEWSRARRLREHNARARNLLLPVSRAELAPAASARSVVVNFRIEVASRAKFFGVAHVAMTGDEKQIVALTVHRSAPRDGLTGEQVRDSLRRSEGEVDLFHWQWQENEPYELIERGEIPW